MLSASFRKELAEKLHVEFDFIDAPFADNPAPGIGLFYEPPYFSFYRENTIEAISAARRWLLDLIFRSGPYDAVIMFSQGCVLGAATLLLHAAETPHLPPPFRAAIFICGGPPLTVLETLGFEISDEVRERDLRGRKALMAQASSDALLKHGGDRWQGMSSDGETKSEEEIQSEISGPYQIRVPTVHIYGSKDPRYAAGVQLSGLCEKKVRRTFDHGGGHEIPRKQDVSKAIAELVRWVLTEAHQS